RRRTGVGPPSIRLRCRREPGGASKVVSTHSIRTIHAMFSTVIPRHLVMLAALACGLLAAPARADSLAVVDPLPPGPYAVGCSNVAEDFSRVQPGESAQNYWEGYPDGSRQRYVTQLLADPADALVVNVNAPIDRE